MIRYNLQDIILAKGHVNRETLDTLEKIVRPFSYLPSTEIVKQGEKCDHLYFISCGLCRITYSRGARETTVAFGGGGEIYTSFHALAKNLPAVLSLVSITECEGWSISLVKFHRMLDRFPDFSRWFLKCLVNQLCALEMSYTMRALHTGEEQFENYMNRTYLKDHTSVSKEDFNQDIPLKILAQYLGVTQQTLSVFRRKYFEKSRQK